VNASDFIIRNPPDVHLMSMHQTMHQPTPSLSHCIAIVTGASRGAGCGIATELGAAGATVYVTGRSQRHRPATTYQQIQSLSNLEQLPGSIEQTAENVTAAGGRGIAVACDHTDDAQVRVLFERVRAEQGRGLIVTTTFWDRDRYMAGNLFYDLAKASMTRLAFGMAEELRVHNVASVAVSPGWMRTEFVLASHQTDETHWQSVPALARTESPRYLGRAVVALASDPNIMSQSGQVLRVGDLARFYGFTDIDGRVPPPYEI
jgi:NAD(P)-dependent dehydrogenase (short-subunit alcohol dehydrogenase family)